MEASLLLMFDDRGYPTGYMIYITRNTSRRYSLSFPLILNVTIHLYTPHVWGANRIRPLCQMSVE